METGCSEGLWRLCSQGSLKIAGCGSEQPALTLRWDVLGLSGGWYSNLQRPCLKLLAS